MKVKLKLEKLDIIKSTESVGIEVSKSKDEARPAAGGHVLSGG